MEDCGTEDGAKDARALPLRRRGSLPDEALLAAMASESAAAPSAGAAAPPFLRGTLLAQYTLKETLRLMIAPAMAAAAQAPGFHAAKDGAVALASALLLAQLCGGGGPPPSPPDAIAALHEAVFENYNAWALQVGGRCVFSARLTHLPEAALAGPGIARGAPPAASAAPPPAAPFAAGALSGVRLAQLCLWYAAKAELANLHFTPELCCWVFHQLHVGACPPPQGALAEWRARAEASGAAPYTSFFSATTTAPLYAVAKAGARRAAPAPAWQRFLPCCARQGPAHALRNSQRVNYDDLNEFFWTPACLSIPHHSCLSALSLAAALKAQGGLRKTFLEKASWLALLLSMQRAYLLQATAMHALIALASVVAEYGGSNLASVGAPPLLALLTAPLACAGTLCAGQVLLLGLSHAHDAQGCCSSLRRPACSPSALAQALYILAWAGVVGVLGSSSALLGFAVGPLFWGAAAARLACAAVADGLPPFCTLSRRGWLRSRLMAVEMVEGGGGWAGALPRGAGGAYAFAGAATPPAPLHVAGSLYMQQPMSRVLQYGCFWAAVMAAKAAFDLQALIEQANLVKKVQEAKLLYSPFWSFGALGVSHFMLVASSWLSIIALCAVDTYIAFCLLAPVLGYAACGRDGLGVFAQDTDVKLAFLQGLRSGSMGGEHAGRNLAEQFVAVCLPLARARGQPPHDLFRHAWDAFVTVLRVEDLVSNEEACLLMYGDGVVGVDNQLPLLIYAGQMRALLKQTNALVQLAGADVQRGGGGQGQLLTDTDYLAQALPSAATEEALQEILLTLPHLLAHVVQSHSAIGFGDAHALRTLQAMFQPPPGSGIRETVWRLLGPAGEGAEGQVRELARLAALLAVNFERSVGESTRLRGSPLVTLAVQLLERLCELWGLPPCSGGAGGGAGRAAGGGGGGGGSGTHSPSPSLPSINLDALAAVVAAAAAAAAGGSSASTTALDMPPPSAAPGTLGSSSQPPLPTGVADTRSVRGILALLALPNEGSGTLDGSGDADMQDKTASLKEASRRLYLLLTMSSTHGTLACAEAERRLSWLVNCLFMHQVPRISSVLHMPSLSVVTPHYSEPILYSKDFLAAANTTGVSPLVYLKAVHPLEWRHLLERLGVGSEVEAWGALRDAEGNAVSGELEVRLWASHRGQTLCRTVDGMLQSAAALRLLASLQLQQEYAALDPGQAQGAREEDAAQAALWWVRERFNYVLAGQRYAEHGEEDVVRRAEADTLLLRHPLLSLAYWETCSGGWGRSLMTVLRQGVGGVVYRIPCPGNPVLDGIGEGKPHNQLNGVTFAPGRCLQTIDMNQQGYFELSFLLPHALSLLLPRGGGGGGSDGVTPSRLYANASGRPLVCLGLREHIYTHSLSAPAFFMSQQEYLFGVLWQRLMASPLRVRMHYGHPDIFDAVWIGTRGGTAKASAVVNVSEDVFAGFTVALRGGESGHVSFVSVGKGRDVGMLQIEVFESKISGGTAISGTTRDGFRALAGMDLARQFSAYHTGFGFYISNVLAIASAMIGLYYMTFMACSGASAAVQRSNTVFLLGSITFLQWMVQMGLLSVIPLATLYLLEHGPLRAAQKTLHLFACLSPIFFSYEIATKAYFFDSALAFGQQSYLATGRDFVIRHTSFVEVWSAAAHSHFYLGGEAIVLLLAITTFGSFDSQASYLFFFLSTWLFGGSLLVAPLFFNPAATELRALRADWREWGSWLLAPAAPGGAGASWLAWHKRVAEGPYAQASLATRAWRAVRVSRLLLAAALLLTPLGLRRGTEPRTFLLCAAAPWGALCALQLLHEVGELALPAAALPHAARLAGAAAHAAIILGAMGGALLLAGPILGGFTLDLQGNLVGLVWGAVALFLCAAWASRLVCILGLWPLLPASRALWCFLDAALGSLLLALQCLLAALLPLATFCHTRVMYSRTYADAVAVLNGSRDALEAHSSTAGVRSLGLSSIEPLAFGSSSAGGGGGAALDYLALDSFKPRYHLGARRWRLKKLEGFVPMRGAGEDEAGVPAAAAAAAAAAAVKGEAAAPAPPPTGSGTGLSFGFGALAALGGSSPTPGAAGEEGAVSAVAASAPALAPAPAPLPPQALLSVAEIFAAAARRAPPPAPAQAPLAVLAGGKAAGAASKLSAPSAKGGSGSGSAAAASSSSTVGSLRARFERK